VRCATAAGAHQAPRVERRDDSPIRMTGQLAKSLDMFSAGVVDSRTVAVVRAKEGESDDR